jgi:hypothetical protein
MDINQSRPISVLEPIGAAIEKTKQTLFDPFDIKKWFAIGFCAWLATLGNGGGGGTFNYRAGSGSTTDIRSELANLKVVILENLPVILPIATVVILLVLTLTLVLMWLKSRGQFMLLDCVARNVGQVVNPWKQYGRHANSLFLFKLVLWLLASLVSLVFIVPLVVIFISFAKTDFQLLLPGSIVSGVLLFLGFICLCLFVKMIKTLTKDFVVPVMYLQNCSLTEGWRRFWSLCSLDKGSFICYLLFLFVVNLAIALIIILLVLITCCCAACFLRSLIWVRFCFFRFWFGGVPTRLCFWPSSALSMMSFQGPMQPLLFLPHRYRRPTLAAMFL